MVMMMKCMAGSQGRHDANEMVMMMLTSLSVEFDDDEEDEDEEEDDEDEDGEDEDDDNTLSSLSVIYKPNIHTVNDDEMLMTVRMR
jgi:hypothetical protein